jgi:hypothetical protein
MLKGDRIMGERHIEVRIDSKFPLFIHANADAFGAIFASMYDEEQVALFRAMIEHMRRHAVQWDYIAIQLEKDENRELRDTLRMVLFPEAAALMDEVRSFVKAAIERSIAAGGMPVDDETFDAMARALLTKIGGGE